jgi:ketosteroid isomerase-like protein
MIRSSTAAFATALFACAAALADVPGHQPGAEARVLATVDRFIAAISARDLVAMAALQMPDGMTFVSRPQEGGGNRIVVRPNSYWVDPSRAAGPPLRERYWSPTVLVRGQIAVVWAPYEFWVDGKTSHCGVDVFDLVEVDGAWRVANMMWTVEPDACATIRPADASALRPAGE